MKTLSGGRSDLPTMSIKTRDDNKRSSTSSRRLSNEQVAMHHSSGEVYYAGAPVAVPFKWESQPGTPRVGFRETPLPPLTPPPSFLFNSPKQPTKRPQNQKEVFFIGSPPLEKPTILLLPQLHQNHLLCSPLGPIQILLHLLTLPITTGKAIENHLTIKICATTVNRQFRP
ncbi:hypothetical protein OSB04_023338 [Centaurea solstitialis]|uniref:Uncharacterized protein n=1 Tax=Centaurea solstitialis TaxID=347529 RepID=A0AA38SXB5_9ASTR|nr:hypothetical protein OSB04_023338 [Centaurea solstitialis]